MARPRINIDPVLVEKLASIHCTNEEIAFVCGCSRDTIERRYAAEIAKGRAKGKIKLRQGLWELADRGNLGALVWLSKQHLGMREPERAPAVDPVNETATGSTSSTGGIKLIIEDKTSSTAARYDRSSDQVTTEAILVPKDG